MEDFPKCPLSRLPFTPSQADSDVDLSIFLFYCVMRKPRPQNVKLFQKKKKPQRTKQSCLRNLVFPTWNALEGEARKGGGIVAPGAAVVCP